MAERRELFERHFRESQLLKGKTAGTAWECRESAACCGRGGFLSLSRGRIGLPLSARLAGSCARAQEKHCSVALKSRCPPCCVLRAKSSADFGGIGGRRRGRPGAGNGTVEERVRCGRASLASSAHSARRMFVKTPQRSLTAMPSSRSSSTSFCASAGTASRHTGESPSSMVL